ncbi:hypothetical protein SOVF_076340 [Spinacia oleracea]|nr:hypothetical protein SOVF_076340 [Spinacia oleracea]
MLGPNTLIKFTFCVSGHGHNQRNAIVRDTLSLNLVLNEL